MADKATRKKRASINVSPALLEDLNAYLEALESQKSRKASQSQLIGALLDGVPLWQADIMIGSYRPPPSDSPDTGEPT